MSLGNFFRGRIVEISWFFLSFSGVVWFIVANFFIDHKSNPIFLSQINAAFSSLVMFTFIMRKGLWDKVLKILFFPMFANSICIAIGRLYLDLDHGGPWVVHFQEIKSNYTNPILYRSIDFFAHFIIPIAFLHLVLNNKEWFTRIFKGDSISSFFLHYLLPIIFFSAWYAGICICGYTLKDIYLTRALGLNESIFILLIAPLMVTLPVHYALAKEKGIWKKSLEILIYLGCFSILCTSFFTYHLHTLHLNAIFLMSLVVFILISLKYLKIIDQKTYQDFIPLICALSIFTLFINEMHIWSMGGNEKIYLSTLQKTTHYSATNLHYIIKIMFYILNVFALYTWHVFYNSGIIASNIMCGHSYKKIIYANILVFFGLYFFGIFRHYDIQHTQCDPILFLIGMIIAIELTIPIRCAKATLITK